MTVMGRLCRDYCRDPFLHALRPLVSRTLTGLNCSLAQALLFKGLSEGSGGVYHHSSQVRQMTPQFARGPQKVLGCHRALVSQRKGVNCPCLFLEVTALVLCLSIKMIHV